MAEADEIGKQICLLKTKNPAQAGFFVSIMYTTLMQKAVIFDLGDVLVIEHGSRPIPAFHTHLKRKYSNKELERLLYGSTLETNTTTLFEEYHLGTISSRGFYQRLQKHISFAKTLTFEKFRELWPNRFTRNEEVIQILRQLTIHKRYLLSDTNEMDSSWIMSAFPDIFMEFDKVFFSFRTKADKYGPQAWHNVMKESGLPPEAHVFIDNNKGHVERARSLGLYGIVYTTPKKLWGELKKLGYQLCI